MPDFLPHSPVSWPRDTIGRAAWSQSLTRWDVAKTDGTIFVRLISSQLIDPGLPENSRGIRKSTCIKPLGDTCDDLSWNMDLGWESVLCMEVEKVHEEKSRNQSRTTSLMCCY